jgi:5-methylcytosine-specific restriction enzyme subunit McrC
MVTVRELREGLEIGTTSFVGSITLGSLTVRIQPKMDGGQFSALLAYAIGLPQIELLPEHDVSLTTPAFQDLLVARLAAEASRLLARGIHRSYVSRESSLSSPRGRIQFRRLATSPRPIAALPCRYEKRDQNVLPNQVLLAGLNLASRTAIDPSVRTAILRPAAALAELAEPIILNAAVLRNLERTSSRLTSTYESAFALIRLLMTGHGISTTMGSQTVELPGFLFNMNRLFQEVLGRFLREWITDADVFEQYLLTDLFGYQTLFNPKHKRAPRPRPDYVVTRLGRVVAIADAKYRDLWEHQLPAEMLYQVAMYALSQDECRSATILYATTAKTAREARVSINDPLRGSSRGEVCLRPVVLQDLAHFIRSPRAVMSDRRRREYARFLVYGSLPPTVD